MIILDKDSNLLKLPELVYGTIKRVGILNNEPILYGDHNLLKNGNLYYILGAKLVYRYIKTVRSNDLDSLNPDEPVGPDNPKNGEQAGNDVSTMSDFGLEDQSTYHTYLYFDTIDTPSTDGLSIPEDERGLIHRAGYLFNEIIYSGDPNLVENGSLFYHDTLPYISIISNVDGIINLSTKEIDENSEITTVITEYRVNPELHDYSKDYLTFEALEDGTFTFTKAYYNVYGTTKYLTTEDFTNIGYSLDNGNTWIMLTNSGIAELQTITTPTVSTGEKVIWKGISQYHCISGVSTVNCAFSSTGEYRVSGNIMSILYGDNFSTSTMLPQPTSEKYTLSSIFGRNTKLTSAENLILPATLVKECYRNMFNGCASLTAVPKLPAITLADSCYYGMFRLCTSLTVAPELPATTLAQSCYWGMFDGCTYLTSAPELPAMALAQNCYRSMFKSCPSLTTAPELPATTLASSCYREMFYGCTGLTSMPELPATILEANCYDSMFQGCTSVVNAPELPATILAAYCYLNMFQNCRSLRYIKMMATNVSATNCLLSWVSGVAATGTFVKNSAATWNVTGVNGVPTDWTVETADADTNEITI